MTFGIVCLGLLLDQLLGEIKRFHPLVGFGYCADKVEQWFNISQDANRSMLQGILAYSLLVLPIVVAGFCISDALGPVSWIFSVLVIYFAIGFKSLLQHSNQVSEPLGQNDIEFARFRVAMMLSRDTAEMSEAQITSAAIESTLENGCDSTFAVLFWYLVGGVPMVLVYRLSNTLDAMWGYRTQRFEYFGKCAAKVDDILNYVPARVTAVFYALCGKPRNAINSWRTYAKHLASPNGSSL